MSKCTDRHNADFSTIKGHDFRVVNSFALSETDLRSVWDRLLNCKQTGEYKPKRVSADLAIQFFAGDDWLGAAEIKWANNSLLVLLRDYFSVPIFDAESEDAQAIKRDFDRRLL